MLAYVDLLFYLFVDCCLYCECYIALNVANAELPRNIFIVSKLSILKCVMTFSMLTKIDVII